MSESEGKINPNSSVEAEGLEHKVGSCCQEAGETPEFAVRTSTLPVLQCIVWKRFFGLD